MRNKHAVLGGTFDHLHEGHKHFINSAFKKAEFLTIGITVDEFSRNKLFANSIQDLKTRKENLKLFILKQGLIKKFKVVEINDPFGTTLDDKTIDAIFVTTHGLSNAKIINKKRSKKKLSKLTINKVSFLRGKDKKIISSTRIRKGEIDRFGEPYIKLFKKTLALPASLRERVKTTPSGKLIVPEKLDQILINDQFVIAVGDVSSAFLKSINKQADIKIVDYKVNRKPIGLQKSKNAVKNDPGTINKRAVLKIQKALDNPKKKQVIEINGEEDLLALPTALLAPLNSIILYGMPDRGMIFVNVTEQIKSDAFDVVKKFRKI